MLSIRGGPIRLGVEISKLTVASALAWMFSCSILVSNSVGTVSS